MNHVHGTGCSILPAGRWRGLTNCARDCRAASGTVAQFAHCRVHAGLHRYTEPCMELQWASLIAGCYRAPAPRQRRHVEGVDNGRSIASMMMLGRTCAAISNAACATNGGHVKGHIGGMLPELPW